MFTSEFQGITKGESELLVAFYYVKVNLCPSEKFRSDRFMGIGFTLNAFTEYDHITELMTALS